MTEPIIHLMDMPQSPPRPAFRNPPVVETVLGVQFKPLVGWDVPHFGLYWDQVRERLPKFQVKPALPLHIEGFDRPSSAAVGFQVQLSDIPDARCWYLAEDNHEMIQIQRERFIYNWRKGDSNAEYPRYDQFVRPSFQRNWDEFLRFLQEEKIAPPDVTQCEVTYVNHIPKGDGWNQTGDWDQVFTMLKHKESPQFLEGPETASLNFNFIIGQRKGRLRVTANSAVRQSDGMEIIDLKLTARGKPDSAETEAILEWIDLGREWVVRGFADLTTETMHKLWVREA